MRYFLDTEFIEAGAGQTIDLISIGLVCEDGREYYAVNIDCDFDRASNWVVKNVLSHLPSKPSNAEYRASTRLRADDFFQTRVGKEGWRSRQLIADEIVNFIDEDKPEFWGYYADYDHVVFCQLFGAMIDLPKGFPMYMRDLKQIVDELGNPRLPEQSKGKHNALADARWTRDSYAWLKENYSHPGLQ